MSLTLSELIIVFRILYLQIRGPEETCTNFDSVSKIRHPTDTADHLKCGDQFRSMNVDYGAEVN